MEDGEIQEDISGASYHPSLEWQGNDYGADSSWTEAAGPSTTNHAPQMLVHNSQAQVGAHRHFACSLTPSSFGPEF